jgi:uncharacterized C2H2 Zn-finger protein
MYSSYSLIQGLHCFAMTPNVGGRDAQHQESNAMARPRKGTFKCGRCQRKFSMAAHLARHMAAMHGVKKTGKRTYTKRMKRPYGKVGRPTGIVARLGLRDLGLEQLSLVIDAARQEARRQLLLMEAALR